MTLPGGLFRDGNLHLDYRFKPVTGVLERAFAESGLNTDTLPRQVSRVLASSLAELGGLAVDEDLVRALSAGDRQYLMRQLEALIDPGPRWTTVVCRGCEEFIQFQVEPGDLPVKRAGTGYPHQAIQLTQGEAWVRVVTGADEEALARDVGDAESGIHYLLQRLVTVGGSPVDPRRLSESDFQAIDDLLDKMSPQPALTALVECPYCQLAQDAVLDPCAWLARESSALDQDVHLLALHYHWSEQDIFSLSRSRREIYLRLIEQSLGRYRADDLIREAAGRRR